ncbi:MAG: anti-sigma factor RsbA family regulatory protein [Solirubrobacterales bacterium]
MNAEPGAVPGGCRGTQGNGFRHEAWLYEGAGEFADGAAAFVRDGRERDEAVMVATTPWNLRALRAELGADAGDVALVDMTRLGRNPGAILSAWGEFAVREAGLARAARGIGEPVWHGRSEVELEECARHEALINSAFSRDVDFRLLCPYDMEALDEVILEAVDAAHPDVYGTPQDRPRGNFDPALADRALEGELPPPPAGAEVLRFDGQRLSELRGFARGAAGRLGLPKARAHDVALAVNELAANEIVHGAGHGTLTVWAEGDCVICQVEGEGRLGDPLVGRATPDPKSRGGRGVWLVHQVCDLVQLRSAPTGTVARIAVGLRG